MHYESCYAESCYAKSCYAESSYAESCYTESRHAESCGMSQPLTVAHRSGQLAFPIKKKGVGGWEKSKPVDSRHSMESGEETTRKPRSVVLHL